MQANFKKFFRAAVLPALIGAAVALAVPLPAAGGQESAGGSAPSGAADIILQGKLYCPLKRQVLLPFKGIVTAVGTRTGQQVKQGEVLARYRLSPDSLMQLRRRLSVPQIGELDSQMAEADKNLAGLRNRQVELQALAGQKMAPAEALRQVEREIQLVERHRATLKERVGLERQLARDDMEFLKESLGKSVSAGSLPAEVSVTAPIAGYVAWAHADLREHAEFNPGTPLYTVAVMDPMIVRASTHEMEAMQIRVGDRAEVTIESLPGAALEAAVSRISWTPQTPGLDQPTYYEVEFTLPNPATRLREGLTAQIVLRKAR
ncbi:MAG: efflux RND transporter periplasmic adaptor subunit [Syntrophobacteraceae bacterium]